MTKLTPSIVQLTLKLTLALGLALGISAVLLTPESWAADPAITVIKTTVASPESVGRQGFLRESTLANVVPDSLRKLYPNPVLEADEISFAPDSAGGGLFLNVLSRADAARVFVVGPDSVGKARLVWVSKECRGVYHAVFADDINQDGRVEIGLSLVSGDARRPAPALYLWRWEDSVAVAMRPCGDSTRDCFTAEALLEVNDVDGDGVRELVGRDALSGGMARGGSATQAADIYRWDGRFYCLRRNK